MTAFNTGTDKLESGDSTLAGAYVPRPKHDLEFAWNYLVRVGATDCADALGLA